MGIDSVQHLFLHIGTNKTATSLIQSYCVLRRDWLHRHDIIYPDTGRVPGKTHKLGFAHHHLGTAIKGNRAPSPKLRTDRSIQELAASLKSESKGYRRIILSTEMLWRLEQEDVPRLRALLDAFEQVTVIGYIRRQDSWAQSAYTSKIKNGIPESLPPFGQFCDQWDMDFGRAMRFWDEIKGDGAMVVRPFVKETWKNQDILEDFFSVVSSELRPPPAPDGVKRNESWPLPALEILRHLNAVQIPNRRGLTNAILKAVKNIPTQSDEGLLTPEIQDWLLDRYRASNQDLAARCWTEQEARLFHGQRVTTYSRPYSGLRPEDCARVIAAFWQSSLRSNSLAQSPTD